ncbi:MAG: hypothetical protein WBI40_07565 [Methylococcaceae bacterium]
MALVKVKNAGKIGLNRDLSAHELPLGAWTDCQNIRFLDGYAYQFFGYGEVYNSPSFVPQHVLPCNVAGNRYWIYLTPTKAFAVTNTAGVSTHTDITHVTPRTGVVNQWTSTLLSGVPIVNAGDGSVPMAWDLNLANKFVNLTNWQAGCSCKSLRAFKNFLIALNVTKSGVNYPYMVKWSHPADAGSLPSSWNEADATKQAGENDIAEGYDPIVDGLQLRDSFIIYKEQSTWRMDFIGGNYVFRFTKILGKSGAMNRNCIADIDGAHVVLTNDDIIIHDGNSAQSVLDKATRRWLFQNIDVDGVGKCFVFSYPFFNEIYICYPSIGSASCDKAIVYNYKDKTISARDMPNVNHAASGAVDNGLAGNWSQDSAPWGSDLSLWNGGDFVPSAARLIAGSANTKLYMLDSSASFDGAIPNAFLERRGLSFEVPENMKLVRGIRPRISGNIGDTVQIQIGSQDDPFTEPTWGEVMNHVIGQTISNDCLISGRYIAIRFATGTAFQWRLDSFDLDIQQRGIW